MVILIVGKFGFLTQLLFKKLFFQIYLGHSVRCVRLDPGKLMVT